MKRRRRICLKMAGDSVSFIIICQEAGGAKGGQPHLSAQEKSSPSHSRSLKRTTGLPEFSKTS